MPFSGKGVLVSIDCLIIWSAFSCVLMMGSNIVDIFIPDANMNVKK